MKIRLMMRILLLPRPCVLLRLLLVGEREDVGEETVKYPGVKVGFVIIATLNAILKRSLE